MLSIMVWNNVETIYRTHTDRLFDTAKNISQQFSDTAASYMFAVDYASLEEYAENVTNHREVSYLTLKTTRGNTVLALGSSKQNDGAKADLHPTQVTDGIYDIVTTISLSGQVQGNVAIGFSMQLMDETIDEALRRSSLIAAIEVLLSVIVTIMIGLTLTRNLSTFTQAVARVGSGKYDIKLPCDGKDELNLMARTFNKMVVDINDRTQKIEAGQKLLYESEQRLQSILDNTSTVVYMKNIKGEYLLVNRQYEKLFNITTELLVGKTDFDLFPQEMAEEFRANDVAVQKAGKAIQSEESALQNGKVHVYISIKFPLYNEKNEMYATCGISTDITDRKTAEAKLQKHHDNLGGLVAARTKDLERARDEALHATRVKSQFLANMSHELRTPLNSILGFSGILKDGMAGEVNPEQSAQLNMIYESGQHLLQLISDILDLTRVESGKLSVEKETIELAELLSEVCELLRPLATEKQLQLLLELPELPIRIYSDRTKLRQTLINLIGNAIKFTDVGTITVQCNSYDNDLQLKVIDTGIGIPKSMHNIIFNAFEQIENGDSRLKGGAGLGLAISKRIIELIGGKLTVESVEGQGSVFTIDLANSVVKASEHNLLNKVTET